MYELYRKYVNFIFQLVLKEHNKCIQLKGKRKSVKAKRVNV